MRRPYQLPHVGRIARIPRVPLASDAVRPTLVSVTIPAAGTSMTLVYSKAVTFGSGAVSLAGTRSSTGTYSSGSGTASLVFTLGTTILSGDVETLSVAAGAVTDASGNVNAVISGSASTNNSTATSGPSVRTSFGGQIPPSSSAVTLPTRVSGDTLVAVIGTGSAVPAANTGWTRRINQASGDTIHNLAVYTRQSDGTDNTPLGGTLATGGAYIIFSVQNPASGYDISGSANGTSTSITAPTVTTTATNDVLISAYLRQLATGTITPPGGQTTVPSLTDPPATLTLDCGYETLAASGATGTRAATNSTSTGWIAANTAVK